MMQDLISRQAAIRWVKTECNPYGKPTIDFESGKKVIEHLEQMPPEQPRKGKWIGYNADDKDWQRDDGSPIFMNCSECHGAVINNGSAHWNFCPNCGCRMEEGDAE